ncbi:MAG: hypothetical protein JNK82_16870 [Myxococcaceae bacterium]|nr:hypothetical protein [Myxococcaceae bacterium]
MKTLPALIITLCLPALTGCVGFEVRKQNAALGALAEFEGMLSDGDLPIENGRPLIVLLVREDGAQPKVEFSQVMYRAGRYHFFANEGRYSVFAFADLNSNLRIDEGEPRVTYPRQLLLQEGKLRASIDLMLSTDTTTKPHFEWAPIHDELVTIADDRFRERMGRKGHWAPGEFRKEVPVDRLYLLEPYDPNKLPVLYVPGIGGTPDDMRAVMEGMDKSRYQPWLFWYASGMRMNLAAQSLKSLLDEYRVLHDFQNVVVVSQCVGGLVARDAVAQLQDRDHKFNVAALVTFSTPWGGHGMAESGTTISPMTVPIWYDMKEGSEFQKQTIATAIPSVPHYMFFSYGQGSNVGDDGTVALNSELDVTMQQRATEVIGFGVDHMGIVTLPQPLQHFQNVLGRVRERVAAGQAGPAGASSSR